MKEDQFVPLNRTFREVSEEEIDSDNFEYEYDWDLWGHRKQTDWTNLELRFRTVILAEGGAGKTREMQERCNLLQGEGKKAWFIELEMLADEPIEELLELKNKLSDFINWRDSSHEPAWLFLDAVDELKLKEGDFEKALLSLRRSIGAAHDRAHILLSCRPSDWEQIDIRSFTNQLPAPKIIESETESVPSKDAIESGEERFLAPLKGNPKMDSNDRIEQTARCSEAKSETLRIFQIRKLTQHQVRQFVEAYAPEVSLDFLKVIDDDDRWEFARQPQDLLELLALWHETNGRLGTYKQQHEAFLLKSLRERDDRPNEASQLSPEKARAGAERLALSLTLSKKRTLLNASGKTPVGSTSANVCPRELLSNWSSSEIKSLLRLRTFDPPSYGRVKYHRRDVQEYLAAGRLIDLARAGNDSTKKLGALLFSKGPSGEEILLPSMKGIAAWVAVETNEFADRVRSKIIAIEPELLLTSGDPEHLATNSKKLILNKIAELHSQNSRRDLSYKTASLKRFAIPELANTIESIFKPQELSDSAICLLLALVKEGKIAECSEMLARVAMQSDYSNHWRALAIMGLVACKKENHLTEITLGIFNNPQNWPIALLTDVIDELVPTHLSIEQLDCVLTALGQNDNAPLSDFSQPMERLTEKLEYEAPELESILASLIRDNQLEGSRHYHPTSRWTDLAPALLTLCLANNKLTDDSNKQAFFNGLTAIWFWPEHYYGGKQIDDLVEHLIEAGIDRSLIFQWQLEYALNYFPSKPNEPLVVRRSILKGINQNDSLWLEQIVRSKKTDIRIRLSALLERFRLWNTHGRPKKEEKRLRCLGGNHKVVNEYLEHYLAQKNKSEEEAEWEEIDRKKKDEEENRLKGWLDWRHEILANPKTVFSGKNLHRNRHLMLEWLMADNKRNGSYQVWSRGIGVTAAFSEEVKTAAASTFRDYWRNAEIQTYSERAGKNSSTLYSWIYALLGVSIESETPNWEARLTDAEVQQATKIGMVEINGLANFVEQLVHKRPQPVKAVLAKELGIEWAKRTEVSNLPLLQNLSHGSPTLKSLLLEDVISQVLDWTNPSELSDEASGWVSHHLSEISRVITSCWDEVSAEQRSSLRIHCEKALRQYPQSRFSIQWLRLLLLIDVGIGFSLLEEVIENHPPKRKKDAAVGFFATLFGNRFRPATLASVGSPPDIKHLGGFIQLAYKHIVPAEDLIRPSGVSYTPGVRDDAEQARSALVNQLIELEGPIADKEIERLANCPECASIKEYLRARHQVRAENRADRSYSISEISEIETRFESTPKDRDSLFRVMMARLEDLQDFIDTDDFVPLLTLQRIENEEEMQRAIAMLLKQSSNEAYTIFREPEVKDRKRTDIQFSVPGLNVESVIEIKVGEKPAWTVSELLDKLENQLVNQYLLQRNRKAGCFLVTYGGHNSECSECGEGFKPRKKWKNPASGKLVDFVGLIELLQARAKEIEEEHDGEIRLGVFGLDLRGLDSPINAK